MSPSAQQRQSHSLEGVISSWAPTERGAEEVLCLGLLHLGALHCVAVEVRREEIATERAKPALFPEEVEPEVRGAAKV